jgi:hypothetical protein
MAMPARAIDRRMMNFILTVWDLERVDSKNERSIFDDSGLGKMSLEVRSHSPYIHLLSEVSR